MKSHGYQQYKKTKVETANQGKLIIMLYEGGIKFSKLAKKSLDNGDYEQANNYLLRAQDIINELMVTLDRDKGGEIANNLYQLYEYMNYQLIQANVKKSSEPIDIVLELMMELLESWKEIISNNNENKTNNVNVTG